MIRNSSRLVAIKAERRTIGCAVLKGTHLDFVELRQLSSDHARADSSALGFVHWMVNTFEADSAALEVVDDRETRRGILTTLITDSLRQAGVSVWLIRKPEVLSAYGLPPPRTRRQVRETVKDIWPILASDRRNGPVLDATALGLHVQTERQFVH